MPLLIDVIQSIMYLLAETFVRQESLAPIRKVFRVGVYFIEVDVHLNDTAMPEQVRDIAFAGVE